MNRSPESKAQWARDKSNRRCGRAKQARFSDEFTSFVNSEAHELRKLRNQITGFEWHVDHVLPLAGKDVCGLHVWSNLRVIPKIENLRKGAKNPLHDRRETRLQKRISEVPQSSGPNQEEGRAEQSSSDNGEGGEGTQG
jgi:hypothetical protein